jgi:hypothetical protein
MRGTDPIEPVVNIDLDLDTMDMGFDDIQF